MYKVYEVEGGWEIFWCPSAPIHYNDRVPYDGKIYSKRPAAYRRVKELNDRLKAERAKKAESEQKETDAA
jgi:hypothetical protein